jgi:hypothetical protein
LSESALKEAEKTRKETGSRGWDVEESEPFTSVPDRIRTREETPDGVGGWDSGGALSNPISA